MSFTRTVLITGGTSGLGYHCALGIARQHPELLVIIASRNDPTSAAETINKALNQENTIYLQLDLSSLANIRSFAQTWSTKRFPPIQALLLNAGGQYPEAGSIRKTEDGIETTFGINHVGHALLFHLLVPYLAEDARIIVTSSGTHDPAQKSGLPDAIYNSAEEIAHPTPETVKYSGRQRYATSKLTNVMWTYALHRRFQGIPGKKMTVVAFDPGLMPGTGLAREAGSFANWLWIHILPKILPLLRMVLTHNVHTPQVSGANLAWVALSPDVKGKSGVYYEGRKTIKSSKDSYDEKKQEDLWEWTVKNISTSEEERKKFDSRL
jgi:NAD(P)-dependent dehydrogenase (short-subunit alcohol dehydrogenase family)